MQAMIQQAMIQQSTLAAYFEGKAMYSEYRMRYGKDQAKAICGRYINMRLRAIEQNLLNDPYTERQFLRGVYYAMIAD